MNTFNRIWGVLLPLLMAGCHADTAWDGMDTHGTTVRLLATETAGSQTGSDDAQLNDIRIYRFDGGTLQEVFGPMTPEEDGTCRLDLKTNEGVLMVLANASQAEGLEDLTAGTTTLEEFKKLWAAREDMAAQGLLMSGQADLAGTTAGNLEVKLKRSVARIDIESTDQGVEVLQASISQLADRGYIYEQTDIASPEQTEKGSSEKTFDTPLANGRETWLYACEQSGEGMTAEVLVRFRGALHRMKAALPAILRRNTTYTLHVYGRGDDVNLNITSDGWEQGSTTGTETVNRALVNREASDLPAGVRVNERGDSVFIPYMGSDFRLALNGESGTTVSMEGQVDKVTVQTAATRNLEHVADVTVSAGHRFPGSIWEYIHLDLYKDRTWTGRVVLACEPNPAKLEGRIVLDENGVCDFGQYVDGELGRLTLPQGKRAVIETGDGETPWLKLDESEDGYRILGGWKPNDPKADGRTQEARLVISDADGSNREAYPIRRVNWGLPVVEIDGTWWCKYNLRGNVKNFDDQVSIADDQALEKPLAEVLATCSDDELLAWMGGQYQGGNPDELPLRHDGSVFYHEGYKSNPPQSWSSMPAIQMAPAGYEVPGYDDYEFFGWGTNSNIGGTGTRTYQNAQGKEITVTVTERNASFLGEQYGTVAFYDFAYGNNHWTLYGLGHQWSTTNGSISRMMIMTATAGVSGSWYMEGYAQADRPGQNWWKYSAQNAQKTRTIRCIKTPVEYIYD